MAGPDSDLILKNLSEHIMQAYKRQAHRTKTQCEPFGETLARSTLSPPEWELRGPVACKPLASVLPSKSQERRKCKSSLLFFKLCFKRHPCVSSSLLHSLVQGTCFSSAWPLRMGFYTSAQNGYRPALCAAGLKVGSALGEESWGALHH